MESERYYYGKEEFDKYGFSLYDQLKGKTISKRIVDDREDFGLRKIGLSLNPQLDIYDLLGYLEALCHLGYAREIDDSHYEVDTKNAPANESFAVRHKNGNWVSKYYTVTSSSIPAKFNTREEAEKFISEDGKDPNWNKYYDIVELENEPLEEKLIEFDPNDWEEEDIKFWNHIDWQKNGYSDFARTDDTITAKVTKYSMHNDPETKEVTMCKYFRANPIYPPYYAAVEKPFDKCVGPMYDGHKAGKVDIHDRYETQEVYDLLSEAYNSNGEQINVGDYVKVTNPTAKAIKFGTIFKVVGIDSEAYGGRFVDSRGVNRAVSGWNNYTTYVYASINPRQRINIDSVSKATKEEVEDATILVTPKEDVLQEGDEFTFTAKVELVRAGDRYNSYKFTTPDRKVYWAYIVDRIADNETVFNARVHKIEPNKIVIKLMERDKR